MPDFTNHPPGSPCWVDLMSPDVDGSKSFYSAVFGWDAEDQHEQDLAGLGGQPRGMGEMPAVWNSYIATSDVAATAEKVTAAGGGVMMPPMQVMDSGEMAIFTDPSGAAFSVWKAGEHIGAQVCNEPNTYSWNELVTRDVDAVMPFYADVFGWTYRSMDMGPMGMYHVVEGGDDGLAGMMAMPDGMPEQVPNHWAVYFTVADATAAVAAITAGGTIVNDLMTIPGVGTMATAHDPASGSFSVMQPEQQ